MTPVTSIQPSWDSLTASLMLILRPSSAWPMAASTLPPTRASITNSGISPTSDERVVTASKIVRTAAATEPMATSPIVASGFILISVNGPLRMSPRPSGRSGMPPGAGAPPAQPPRGAPLTYWP